MWREVEGTEKEKDLHERAVADQSRGTPASAIRECRVESTRQTMCIKSTHPIQVEPVLSKEHPPKVLANLVSGLSCMCVLIEHHSVPLNNAR